MPRLPAGPCGQRRGRRAREFQEDTPHGGCRGGCAGRNRAPFASIYVAANAMTAVINTRTDAGFKPQ